MATQEQDHRNQFNVIFGSRRRMDVWAKVGEFAVEPPEQFTAHAITGELEAEGIVKQTTFGELAKLERLDMITRIDSPSYDRRVHYQRTDSPLWLIVEAAVQAADLLQQKAPSADA